MPYEGWLPFGALLGVVAVSLLVLDSSATSSGTLGPLGPGGPLAMDRPGPALPKLYTLALPTPLWRERVTRFLSESTWGRARRYKHLHINRDSGSAGPREKTPHLDAFPSRLRFMNTRWHRVFRMHLERLTSRQKSTCHPQAEYYMLCKLSRWNVQIRFHPIAKGVSASTGQQGPRRWRTALLTEQLGSFAQGEPEALKTVTQNLSLCMTISS